MPDVYVYAQFGERPRDRCLRDVGPGDPYAVRVIGQIPPGTDGNLKGGAGGLPADPRPRVAQETALDEGHLPGEGVAALPGSEAVAPQTRALSAGYGCLFWRTEGLFAVD